MKNILFTVIIVFITQVMLYSQDNNKSNLSIKLHKVWIKNSEGKIKGFLYSVNQEGITISKKKKIDLNDLIFVPRDSIASIKLRKRGSVARYSLIGGLSGVVLGFGLGMASGDDDTGWISFTKEEKAQAGGILLSVPFGIIGAIVGTRKKKFIIDYSFDIYLNQLVTLEKYSIKYQLGN